MTTPKERPATLGELKKSGYENNSLRQELRRNLVHEMEHKEELFPGIIGYEDTVIPQMENAILSGQDDVIPIIRGNEVNDHPLWPHPPHQPWHLLHE